MLCDTPKSVSIGMGSSIKKNGLFYYLKDIHHFLDGDIIFGNLECVLSDSGYSQFSLKRREMRGDPKSIWDISKIKFNVINIANNHIMQHGFQGFNDTCRVLEENNIKVVGRRGTLPYFCEPIVLNVRGEEICFLGYSTEKDRYCKENVPYANTDDGEIIINDIILSKKKFDKVIVSMHWGDEFIKTPKNDIAILAKKMCNNGADLILGHHSHTIGEIQVFEKSPVFFSLGNICSDMIWNERTREGIIAKIKSNGRHFEIDKVITTKISNEFVVTAERTICPKDQKFNIAPFSEEYDLCEYNSLRKRLCKENRNLSYKYLISRFFEYDKFVFFQILIKGVFSLFADLFVSMRKKLFFRSF